MSISVSARAIGRPRSILIGILAMVATIVGCVLPSVAAAAPPETWGTFGPVGYGAFAFGPDGSIYTTDCGNARIYRITPFGSIHVYAGAGPGGFDNGDAGDGGPALEAHFGCPTGIVFDEAGRLVVADHLNDKIRRIDRHGIVSTIAGQGPRTWGTGMPQSPTLAHAGDGGPALHAVLSAPWDLTYDATGNLYIADRDHDAIRRIDTAGIITTVAGVGVRGYRGDGGPATKAKLDRPLDVTFRRDGRMVIADENNARIREVDRYGVITTIGGTGRLGCDVADGPATASPVQNANSVDIGPDGAIAIASGECNRVLAIRRDGTIHALAGTGTEGCSGLAGGAALAADLTGPGYLRFTPDGSLWLSDDCGIERIDPHGRIRLVADPTDVGPA